MIELHITVWLEQDREELHPITEICPIVVCMPDDAFIPFAGHVKPIEHLVNCL